MTQVTTITGLSSNIFLAPMTPPKQDAEWVTRHRPKASADTKVWKGKHSRSFTIEGYCQRTSDNISALEALKSSSTFTVVDTDYGTITGCSCISLSYSPGTVWIRFSMGILV